MRELNEQELEQVAGGLTFNYIAQEQAGGTALAGNGFAFSKSFAASTHGLNTSSSIAADKGFAFGTAAAVQSIAASSSSVTIVG